MAWTTNPYCQLNDVKLAINEIANNPGTDDAWIQTLIVQAQASIDQYLGFRFQTDGPGSSRLYDGDGGDVLLMEDTLAFTQVLETTFNVTLGANGIWVSGTPLITDITADCFLQPNNISPQNLLRRQGGRNFQEGHQNYNVTGTFGQPSIPADITRACIRLSIHYFKERDANYSSMVSDGQFGAGIRFVPEMPADVCEILDRHKLRLFFARSF